MAKWNVKQQEILDSLGIDKSILVSAAAGSGKTAVLVERIIETVEQGKAGIDEILVVTFTKAAAGQMRKKIITKLEDKASESRDGYIIKQMSLADRADIMTIDSFCNRVVKENFNKVDIDTSFEILAGEESIILKSDILDEVLEDYYDKNPKFDELSHFIMGNAIGFEKVKDIIFSIYNVSASYADPKKWIENAKIPEDLQTDDDFINYISGTEWLKGYISGKKQYALATMRAIDMLIEKYSDVVQNDTDSKKIDVAQKIILLLSADREIIEKVSEAENLNEVASAMDAKWGRLTSGIDRTFDERAKEEISKLRDRYKKDLKNIPDIDTLIEELRSSRPYLNVLLEITLVFYDRLLEEKKLNRTFEFSDISHFAYQILYDPETDGPSDVAKRLSEGYKYIYIDEYQDGNDLQENVLSMVARRDDDGNINNMFMVGDVKQSIYGFRMARPEIFIDKAMLFSEDDDKGILLGLNMNYRSRGTILDATNFVFKTIFTKQFSGMAYDDEVALHVPDEDAYKNNYPDSDLNVGGIPELICIDNDPKEMVVDGEDYFGKNDGRDEPGGESEEADDDSSEGAAVFEDFVNRELEAHVIGDKILEIVNGDPEKGIEPTYILNEEYDEGIPESDTNPRYRRATYGDIVILQRAIRNSNGMVAVYEDKGIPVRVDNSTGYFDAIEVMTILAMLKCVDNSKQDIPYASVLLSNFGGINEEELAKVITRTQKFKGNFKDRCQQFIDSYCDEEDEYSELHEISVKLSRVNEYINKWKKICPYISVSELIGMIVKDTGLDLFVAAMPQGQKRMANLSKMRLMAEQNGGSLSYFLKFIDKCRIHELDTGEASASQDSGNEVRITSIHSSKGLEYPIVIVARLGDQIKTPDRQGNVQVSGDYGVSMNPISEINGYRVRKSGKKQKLVGELTLKKAKVEETRLLYVAMTRAKEKLILVGNTKLKDVEKAFERRGDYDELIGSKSLLEYLMIALSQPGVEKYFNLKVINKTEIIAKLTKEEKKKAGSDNDKLNDTFDRIGNIMMNLDEENPYSFEYPHWFATKLPSSLSVSQVKHAEMEKLHEDEGKTAHETASVKQEDNEDAKETARARAAIRGTIIHSIMEHLDFSKVDSMQDLKDEADRILETSIFTPEERAAYDTKLLLTIFSKDEESIFMRMKRAEARGELFRERQFTAGLEYKDIPGYDEITEEDMAMIQGIIDVYFYEGDDIVLVDYKTDNVPDGHALVDRYKAQMKLYRTVLEKLTGRKVSDIILYSFRWGEVHCLDEC